MRQNGKGRVQGLDSIRFYCAIWVAFSHGGYPPLTSNLDTGNVAYWLINGVYTSMFCGPAAVIVFFLVSGFCIHHPYKTQWNDKNALPFILARLTRISGPILVATLIVIILKIKVSFFYQFVGWSIICEIFYYSIYPILRKFIRSQKGWFKAFLISFAPTLISFFLFPIDLVNYPGVGSVFVIFLGLPCWLLGVLLCYKIDTKKRTPTRRLLLMMRIGIFFLALSTHILALQQIIGHPFTLNFFAIAAFFWLRTEILFFHSNKSNRLMELWGKSSYSIYLMHGIPPHLFLFFGLDSNQAVYVFLAYWILLLPIITIFYFTVEKPFHHIARKIKFSFSPKLAS